MKGNLRRGVVSDPIADMLTRIRNAVKARHAEVKIPSSKLKIDIARVLKEQGYIQDYRIETSSKGAGNILSLVFVERADRRSVISGLKRVSRPGLRAYSERDRIPRVLGGLGISIISTSQGVMSGREAFRAGIGGEVLAYVW